MRLKIPVTRDSIWGSLLGAKTHFASSEGACEMRRSGADIEIRVHQGQSEERAILVKADILNAAAAELFPPKPKKKFDWR